MRAAPRQRSAHRAVHGPEPDHDRRGACAALARAARAGGAGRLRRHRARRRGLAGVDRGCPGPGRPGAGGGGAAVRAARRVRRPEPAHRAADAADRPRIGRARAGLKAFRTGPPLRAHLGCNGLQERAHRTILAIVCQLRFPVRMAVRRSAAPTLADVAVEAGVSQATASRALAGSPLVNANTRQRVWDVAERLHFQPNRLARSLRSGATMAVGLVVPDVGAAFYASALKSAQDVLEAAGYHVLVLNTGRAPEREREALLTLRAHQVDGLLVATSGGYEEIGVPAVFFDNVPPQPDAGAVAMDNDGGIRLLVDHLVAVHGHERIAYLGPPESLGTGVLDGTGRERLEAFRAAGGRAGLPLPPEYVRTSEPATSQADGRAVARELMALAQPPTAIVGGTDELAIGLLRGLRDTGAQVPGDVALVSFDEPGSADLLDPPLTSLDRHDAQLGRLAAEALLRTRRGGAAAMGVLRLPAALSVRRSCGCEPRMSPQPAVSPSR